MPRVQIDNTENTHQQLQDFERSWNNLRCLLGQISGQEDGEERLHDYQTAISDYGDYPTTVPLPGVGWR